MVIKINGKTESLELERINISELLSVKGVEMPDTVSVQLNGEFVKKEDFNNIYVKENNEVDFLYFMGGGQN